MISRKEWGVVWTDNRFGNYAFLIQILMPFLENEIRKWAFSASLKLCMATRALIAVSMSSNCNKAILWSRLKWVYVKRYVMNDSLEELKIFDRKATLLKSTLQKLWKITRIRLILQNKYLVWLMVEYYWDEEWSLAGRYSSSSCCPVFWNGVRLNWCNL